MTTRDEISDLYHQAFADFGTLALWNMRPVKDPLPVDALAIIEALRVEGNLAARALAHRIERLCADQSSATGDPECDYGQSQLQECGSLPTSAEISSSMLHGKSDLPGNI